MGLSKLLAVGRSVRSVTEQPARYKMTQQNLLPTFGGAKATEAQAVEIDPPAAEATPEPGTIDMATWTAAAETAGTPKSKRGPDRTAEFVDATKKLRPFGGCWWFKNPFARTAPPKPENGPVQTELSLDSVKPVRNDLSDSEVELGGVPVRTGVPPGIPTAPKALPDQTTAVTGGFWQRLKKRLFGANDEN